MNFRRNKITGLKNPTLWTVKGQCNRKGIIQNVHICTTQKDMKQQWIKPTKEVDKFTTRVKYFNISFWIIDRNTRQKASKDVA